MDSSVSTVTRLRTGKYRVRFQEMQEVFRFSKTSRLFLGPSKSPMQWVPGVISPWVKRLGLVGDL